MFALERLRMGEPGASAVWRSHVQGCSHCAERLACLEEEERAFHLAAPGARLRQALAAEEERRQARSSRALFLASPLRWALALAACVLAVVLLRPAPPGTELVAKGQASVGLLVQPSGAPTPRPWDGAALRAGDRIQLLWSSPRPEQVAVLGEEASGAVSALFPASGTSSALVAAGARSLGDSFVLDEEAARGRLWIFIAPEPFELGPLLEAVVQRPRDLPAHFAGAVHTLELRGP
jgi:hypothetical protein